ncbi:MAG: HAMP domain-containing histidine kinase [Chloroflexi bacterium]|nr:HAMP domain-containing histidine kinase [Chloroflexota bacterium]
MTTSPSLFDGGSGRPGERHLELYLKRKELEGIRQKELDFFRRLNEARDDLLEQLRHDVRSPLARIKLAAFMVARSVEDDAVLHKYTQTIDPAVEDVVNLVETLTEIIKLETGRYVQTRPTVLLPFLEQIALSHRAAVELNGITFRVDLEAIAPELTFALDPPQIQRVLGNLIGNAVKFTDAGGTITLTCSVDNDQLRLSVADTGCGIEPEALEKVFQRFYRAGAVRDHEGSGLGLYIARQLVLQHQGEIRVESEVGRGSTFVVTIPRST